MAPFRPLSRFYGGPWPPCPPPLPTPLPGCKPSLIDNILTNSTENHILSGVLQFRVSHHFPIFNVFTCPILNAQANSDKNVPSYDFCESNIENLRNHLTEKFSEAFFDYNSQANFCNFIEIIHDTIDSNCKVDDNIMIKSKRNPLYNP